MTGLTALHTPIGPAGGDIQIDTATRCAVVPAGIPVSALRAAAAAVGLAFPHRPARPHATVADQVRLACQSFSWLRAGSPLTRIARVDLVHADGNAEVIVRDQRSRSVRRALVAAIGAGAEMTRLTLDLEVAAAHRVSFIATFDDRGAAMQAAESVIAQGCPSALDVVDESALSAVAGHGEITSYAPGAALLVEINGGETADLQSDTALVEALCRSNGATSVRARRDDAEITDAVDALTTNVGPALRAAGFREAHTAAVPISALAHFIADLALIERATGVRMTVLVDGATATVTVLVPPSATDDDLTLARQALALLARGQRAVAA